jgi:hypothetical protein
VTGETLLASRQPSFSRQRENVWRARAKRSIVGMIAREFA